MNLLECKKVTKYYDTIRVLDDINLSISKGKIVGLLGKNGHFSARIRPREANFRHFRRTKTGKEAGKCGVRRSKRGKRKPGRTPRFGVFLPGFSSLSQARGRDLPAPLCGLLPTAGGSGAHRGAGRGGAGHALRSPRASLPALCGRDGTCRFSDRCRAVSP